MQDADYLRHLKALGKLVYGYDQAAANAATHRDIVAKTFDQVATGDADDNEALTIVAGQLSTWLSAIANGPAAIQALMKTLVEQYVRSTLFLDSFETGAPLASMTTAAILTLFAAEMTEDSKTFDTDGADGFANFFKTEYDVTCPTAGSPTYADATYVVGTIV